MNGNGSTDAGDTIRYTFTVTNTGDVPATNAAVNDPKVGTVNCPSSTLAVNASQLCTAGTAYTITTTDAQAGSVDNTATATGTSPAGATITSSPSSTSTPAIVVAPSLALVKSASPSDAAAYEPGQVITYQFAVTNTGNVTMNNISIGESSFSGTGTLSEPICPVTTLAAGAQEVCTATYTLTSADVDSGSVQNTATASGTPQGSDTKVPSNPSTASITAVPAPGIAVTKSADPGTVTTAGQQIVYSFMVKNTGNVTLSNPTVADTDFSGTGKLSAIQCPETSLVAAQIETCTATYTVTQADVNTGTLTNAATATGTPPGGRPITSVASTTTMTIYRTPGVSVVKTANVDATKVGQEITYSFKITNTGNVTIVDPTVKDTNFSGTGRLSAIDCPSGVVLQPADSTTCTATYTVTQADIDSGELTNTATATGTAPNGLTPPTSAPSTVKVGTSPHPGSVVGEDGKCPAGQPGRRDGEIHVRCDQRRKRRSHRCEGQ